MILVEKSTAPVRIYVPLNGYAGTPQTVAFSARSTADNTEVVLVPGGWTISRQGGADAAFVAIVLTLPEDMPLGEWEYTLTADGATVSQGILRVSEGAAATVQYNANDDYKQYGE
jgi:hypothetical protein